MLTTQTVPQGKDTAIQGELYISLELGDTSWELTASGGQRTPSRYSRAKERCHLDAQAKVHSCYEAGRDGWWPHR